MFWSIRHRKVKKSRYADARGTRTRQGRLFGYCALRGDAPGMASWPAGLNPCDESRGKQRGWRESDFFFESGTSRSVGFLQWHCSGRPCARRDVCKSERSFREARGRRWTSVDVRVRGNTVVVRQCGQSLRAAGRRIERFEERCRGRAARRPPRAVRPPRGRPSKIRSCSSSKCISNSKCTCNSKGSCLVGPR